jgi:two-component system sensor histidine kinase PhoQ
VIARLPALSSITARVAVGAGVVVVVFIVFAAWALDTAFRDSASRAREQRLLAQVYLLMAAAEVDTEGRVVLPVDRLDPALEAPASGLFARVLDGSGRSVWRSGSLQAAPVGDARFAGEEGTELGPPLAPGVKVFDEVVRPDGARWARQRFGVRWAVGDGEASRQLTFVVLEDASAFEAMLSQYRRTLWGWLAWMALLLPAAQAVILRWGLRPLQRLAADLARLESGQGSRLELPKAPELRPLAVNLNALLEQGQRRQARYRDALADLAHSLKTPLALLDARLREPDVPPGLRSALADPAHQMARMIDYQLQRAAAAGRRALAPALPLRTHAERLTAALVKVHADKAPTITVDIPETWSIRVDEGDLTEMLGNLIDNACKWCRQQVVVRPVDSGSEVALVVDDDGPGIDEAVGRRVLERGVRADEAVPGQGIGLAVVREIVEACGGTIDIGRSPLGGARVALSWPAASRTLGVFSGGAAAAAESDLR